MVRSVPGHTTRNWNFIMQIPDIIPTENADRMFSFFEFIGIMMIQLELEFGHQLDEKRLARAFDLVLDAEPVLGCRYVKDSGKPYWKRLDADERGNFFETANEGEYQAFKQEPIEPGQGPQLKGCLLRSGETGRLLLKVTHHVADAAALKDIAGVLSSIYARLSDKPDFVPNPNLDGARGATQLVKRVPKSAYPGIIWNNLVQLRQNSNPPLTHYLPMREGKSADLKYAERLIAADRVTTLQQWGRERDATLNDLFITAFYRAIADQGKWDGKSQLRLGTMVDLRRYLPDRKAGGICNLSTIEFTWLGTDLGKDFESTLNRVTEITRRKKSGWLSVGPYIGAIPITMHMPFNWMSKQYKKLWRNIIDTKNITDSLTNMGPIPPDRVSFDHAPVKAHLLPPVTFPPFMTGGLSGYAGTLTLSVGYYPEAMEGVTMDQFFDAVLAELAVAQ